MGYPTSLPSHRKTLSPALGRGELEGFGWCRQYSEQLSVGLSLMAKPLIITVVADQSRLKFQNFHSSKSSQSQLKTEDQVVKFLKRVAVGKILQRSLTEADWLRTLTFVKQSSKSLYCFVSSVFTDRIMLV